MREIVYRSKPKSVMSQINVTPLVDVMLVLLIIFMVTAPMMREGIDVNLPKVTAGTVSASDEPLVVTIDRKGQVFLEKRKISTDKLGKKLAAIVERKKEKMVLLKADSKVPYGRVVTTMAAIRRAGIEKVGMVTEPLERGGK